jgi:hypothetical protein
VVLALELAIPSRVTSSMAFLREPLIDVGEDPVSCALMSGL